MKNFAPRPGVAVGMVLCGLVSFAGGAQVHAQTQSAMTAQAGSSFAAEDARLNETYKMLMGRLSDGSKKGLRQAQRSWIRFRDDECAFRSKGSAGGSAYGMVAAACREDLTRQRTAQLQSLLQCAEGDLSCPR